MAKGQTAKLASNIAKGEKEIKAIVMREQRTIRGIVSQYSSSTRFATNASMRNSLYAALAKEYKNFGSEIDEWTTNSVDQTAQDFWKFAKMDMALKGTFDSFSGKYIENIVGAINPNTVNNLVGINAAAGGMLATDVRALRSAVSTTIAEGAIEGLNNKQLADRMRRKLDKVGGFTFTDKAGRKWGAENYFGMLNRTIHTNAARQTYAAAGTDAGYDIYVITGGVTGSSARHPGDPCDRWAGKPFSMTGNTKGLPTYDDVIAAGVYHPNCVHSMRVVLPSELKEVKKERPTGINEVVA